MLVRMAIIKILQITNAGEGGEKREPSDTVGEGKLVQPLENSMQGPQKTKNRISMWFSNPTLRHRSFLGERLKL